MSNAKVGALKTLAKGFFGRTMGSSAPASGKFVRSKPAKLPMYGPERRPWTSYVPPTSPKTTAGANPGAWQGAPQQNAMVLYQPPAAKGATAGRFKKGKGKKKNMHNSKRYQAPTKGVGSGLGGFGGFGGVAGGMVMGGVGGYWGGDGTAGDFVGGALIGGAAGAGAVSFAHRGALKSAKFVGERLGQGMGKHAGSAARAMQTKNGRAMMFGSGALLGGGTFGMMFGNNRSSKSRGFNQHRGNGF